MGKIDDLVLVILVLYPSICLANDMMMGVQPVTSLASTSSNQAVQIIQTDQIRLQQIYGQLIQLRIDRDLIYNKYVRLEIRYSTDQWRTTRFLYSFQSSKFAYISKEANLYTEKSNNSDYCLNKCASNPFCFHTYYKYDSCYYQNASFKNISTIIPCSGLGNRSRCINIERYVSVSKNFKIAYDREYQFKIRLLDRYSLVWVEFSPILKYYLKSNTDLNHMQYNSSIFCFGYGDPHYRSFDGSQLNTNDHCSYIVATNNCSNAASSISPKYRIIADHNYAFENWNTTYIRGVHVFYQGNNYSIFNYFQVNGKNVSLPYYSSDKNSRDRVFVYRSNKFIAFDAKAFNVLYDGFSMLKFRSDKASTCGLCSYNSKNYEADQFTRMNKIIDEKKNCI